MSELKSQVDTMLNETEGFLKLKPNFVTRCYMDHARLGLGKYPGDTYQPEIGRWMPERWIASTVEALHVMPDLGEGLSLPEFRGPSLTLRDALKNTRT